MILPLRKTAMVLALGLAAAALIPGQALADRIDGYWCRGAKQFFIEGPRILTPGGKSLSGTYDRHGFRYVVPAGEADAGATVSMVLMNEDLVQLNTSSRPAETEDWKRCGGRIS
jgi:hypothetical protein